MRKNVAGQYVLLVARNSSDGSAATGDAANISAVVAKDGGVAVSSTNSVAEITGLPGHYWLELSAGETNGDEIVVAAESSTSGVIVESIFASTSIDANVTNAATIAGAVWDEPIASHVGTGSTGEALDDTRGDAAAARSAATTAASQATSAASDAASAASDAAIAAAGVGTISTSAALDIAAKVWQVDISAATPGGASSQSHLRDARIAAEQAETDAGAAVAAVAGLNDLSAAEVTAAVPTAAAIADQVWTEAVADHAAPGSTGATLAAAKTGAEGAIDAVEALNDPSVSDIATAVAASAVGTNAAAAASSAAAAVAAVGALNDLSSADVTAAVPTAAAIADQVWDEPIAGHSLGGSTAVILSGTSSNASTAASAASAAVAAVGALNDLSSADVVSAVEGSQVGTDAAAAASSSAAAVSAIAGLNDLSSADVTAAVPTAAAITSAVWGQVIEGTLDAVEAHRIMLAALAGKLSGAASSSISIRDTTDTTNRIVATVDSAGNRLAVTLDPS